VAGGTDSAGQPWEGRHFEPNPAAHDDGTAPERLVEAIRRFRSHEVGEADVVEALRESRLLIPLVAQLGEAGINDHGLTVDKSQELAIVTVAGPDGRTVLPAFTSVEAMGAWNPAARPVPASATRVAVAAAAEGTDLVVLDATSDTEFAIRRPALWALAQDRPWIPSYLDEEVLRAFMSGAALEADVREIRLAPGDPEARLAGPELVVQLALVEGLDRGSLDAVLARLRARWSESQVIAARVDSLKVQLLAAA
jgi:hypothetical protein